MKRFLTALFLILACVNVSYAEEVAPEETVQAEQVVEMTENKVILNIMKQPMNQNSKQRIVMKKNWFVVNVPVNGKIKVQPLKATYEVE